MKGLLFLRLLLKRHHHECSIGEGRMVTNKQAIGCTLSFFFAVLHYLSTHNLHLRPMECDGLILNENLSELQRLSYSDSWIPKS